MLVTISTKRLCDVRSKINRELVEPTLDLDSHADTSVLGRDALIILDHQRPVTVQGYDPSLRSHTYRTVSGVLAYDNPHSGETYHLVIHQAIHIPHLDHHLLCPMQCRVNDVTVNDLPKFLATDPTENTHALTLPDPDFPTRTITLPLKLRGVISSLNVWKPTSDQWNSENYKRLILTSETLTWDPLTTDFEEQEQAMTDFSGNIVRDATVRGRVQNLVINEFASLAQDTADITDDANFYRILTLHAPLSSVDTLTNANILTRTNAPIDHKTLAARWMISPDRAKETVA